MKRDIVFVLGEGSRLPAVACALIAANRASVQTEPAHYRIHGVTEVSIPMGSGVAVSVALSEPVFADGTGFSISGHRKPLPAFPKPVPDLSYPEPRCPPVEYRIIAAYKIWGAFHYFFAYRDQMDDDWDQVFIDCLPKFINVKSAREYNLTVAEMVTHVADSQAAIESEELSDFFGRAPLGLRLRLMNKQSILTEVLDNEARKAGVEPGDIITKLDGEHIAQRINREASYVAASTQQSLRNMVMSRVLNGPEDSSALLTVVGKNGEARDVTLKRSTSYLPLLRHQRTGDICKLLPGNIGYADLDRLLPADVDRMFEILGGTKAIIFDMRGCPNGTASSIAARLTEAKDVAAAIINGPLTLTPDILKDDVFSQSASYFFVQTIPHTEKPHYGGKTVMLIDESTIGPAEHTGLFFEAANKTKFIGSPSAGANGEVSSFVIPGGITIWFSGQDVRHANGGQLQRLGLQPEVTVASTVEGIRAGRDEILEAAIQYLSSQ